MFDSTPDDLDMHVIYDVSHNIAKVGGAAAASWDVVERDCDVARGHFLQTEEHMVNGRPMQLLVHRKGSTRAFPPHHPLIPVDYQVRAHVHVVHLRRYHSLLVSLLSLLAALHCQFIGQPVLIGGTMGTCSYVLTGTDRVRMCVRRPFSQRVCGS